MGDQAFPDHKIVCGYRSSSGYAAVYLEVTERSEHLQSRENLTHADLSNLIKKEETGLSQIIRTHAPTNRPTCTSTADPLEMTSNALHSSYLGSRSAIIIEKVSEEVPSENRTPIHCVRRIAKLMGLT